MRSAESGYIIYMTSNMRYNMHLVLMYPIHALEVFGLPCLPERSNSDLMLTRDHQLIRRL